jgi:hypothetical protein
MVREQLFQKAASMAEARVWRFRRSGLWSAKARRCKLAFDVDKHDLPYFWRLCLSRLFRWGFSLLRQSWDAMSEYPLDRGPIQPPDDFSSRRLLISATPPPQGRIPEAA